MKKLMLFITVNIVMTVTGTSQVYEGVKSAMFSDIKAYNVGDVITVLIVETANASRESKVESTRKSDFSMDANTSGNIGKMTSFLPLFGASSSMENSHDGEEGTEQSDKLTGKLTAVIIERMDSGMLRIQGERMLEVNGETNVMTVEGLVRQRDIRNDNTVYSYNLANAQIRYKKSGVANKLMKPGAVQRTTNYILGIGLVVIAIMGITL